MNNIQQSTRSMTNTVSDAGNYISQSTNNAVNNIQQSIDTGVKSIDIIPTVNSTKEFLESNSLLAKFSFLIIESYLYY